MSDATTMTIKGQVTVPRQIRDRLGLRSGDKMAFTLLSDGAVVMRPKTRRLAELAGSLTQPRATPGFDRGHEPVQGAGRNESGEAIVTMSIVLDTNVSVRLLVRDDEVQNVAARRLVARAAAADEPVLIVLGALLETVWVLRSHRLDKASIAGAISGLLESSGVEFEHPPTVQESLYVGAQHPAPISPTACSRHAPPISAAAHS